MPKNTVFSDPLLPCGLDMLFCTPKNYTTLICFYAIFVSRLKDSTGWILAWCSSYLENVVDRITLNAKVMNPGQDHCSRMVAASSGSRVQLWHVMNDEDQTTKEIGNCILLFNIRSRGLGCVLLLR